MKLNFALGTQYLIKDLEFNLIKMDYVQRVIFKNIKKRLIGKKEMRG